jgi:DNA polymerase III subunit delta
MTADELVQEISKGKIERFYFLHGSEKVYQGQVVQALTQKLTTEDNRDFNLDVFNGGKSSVYQWLDSARTIPFMGGTKLVVVENMKDKIEVQEEDEFKKQIHESLQDSDTDGSTQDAETCFKISREQDIQALIDYAKNPLEGVCLVITADKVDGRKKLLKKLAAEKGSFSCEAPKEYTLIPWVINLAKEQGYSMPKDVAEALVGRVGARPGILVKELEKTLLYAGKKNTISRQDVSEVVGETKREDVFVLTKALVEKNLDEALKILRNQLSHKGDPIQILGAITWQFRMIWEAKSYQAQGIHPGEMAKKMGAHPFAVQKALPYARKFSNQQLRKCYSELVQTDRTLKTSSNKEGAMETLIINLYQAIQD